eukprot:250858-Amphidinium_carterae.1
MTTTNKRSKPPASSSLQSAHKCDTALPIAKLQPNFAVTRAPKHKILRPHQAVKLKELFRMSGSGTRTSTMQVHRLVYNDLQGCGGQ